MALRDRYTMMSKLISATNTTNSVRPMVMGELWTA